MIGIFITKIKWLFRNPWTFIIMTGMSILFALIIGGNSFDKITVPTYTEDEYTKNSPVISMIKEQTIFELDWISSEEELEQKIRSGKSEFGLNLQADDFQIIVGIDSPNVHLLEQTVKNAYIKNGQIEQIQQQVEVETEMIDNPAFEIETANFHGKDTFVYDGNLHTLFGFSLFFVIYTIGYSVFQIMTEKNSGIWDRMILSPVRKWEMYAANFLYSFLIGYTQVLIVFFVFRYIVKVDFRGTFTETLFALIPYVLAIVALSILITGLVKTVQQFNAVIPIVSLGTAMLGGAFWPLEIVESKFMLTLAKFVPITYGMEALSEITIYGNTTEEILYPVSILLLMTVAMTGIGIHLMEKRYIS